MSTFDVPAESRKKYLTRRLAELDQLEQSGETELAKRVGHQIKGNAATFLFPTLAELGAQLEQAAVLHDDTLIKKTTFEMKVMVQNLLTEL
jgi:HPt (histidine-containing phosphotransfer) domain-containing protein